MAQTSNFGLTQPQMSDKVSATIPALADNFALIDKLMPVGYVLQTTKADFNPNTAYTGTAWTQLHDVFLVASGAQFAGGSTGGSISHKHLMPLGFDQNRLFGYYVTEGQWHVPAFGSLVQKESTDSWNDENSEEAGMQRLAYTKDESHLPPYKAVYMWERTA